MTQDKALKVLKSGKNVFLTGEPGSGKTYTINQFTDYLKKNYIPYAVTASTGIAATHINGITIHSWSGIGIKETITDNDLMNIERKRFVVERIMATKVLIIDEVSMLSAGTLDNINKVVKYLRNFMSSTPFGGLQVVFVGDFFQLPPVTRGEKEMKFAFESEAWKEANPVNCYLHEQHRQSDTEFLKILTAIRQGEVTEAHRKRLGKQNKIGDAVTTKLFTHNTDVDRLNEEYLFNLDTEERVYEMASSGIPFLVEILKKNCMSPEVLKLRIGAVVMFTKNCFEDGRAVYVNGTFGTVVEYTYEGMPVIETKDGNRIEAKPAEWSIEENGFKKATVSQIPLRLAWAITVHKSQGMSLDSAAIDLSKAFESGQGYVAISRVKSLDGLYLKGMNKQALQLHPRVIEQDTIFREQSDLVDQEY